MEHTPSNKSWIAPVAGIIGIVVMVAVFFLVKKPASAPDTTPDMNVAGDATGTSAPHETINPNPPAPTTNPAPTGAKSYTATQVATHNNAGSCWTIINGNVYDVTAWINQHPGGAQAILSLCGHDGSGAFDTKHGGQPRPESELATFQIGILTK